MRRISALRGHLAPTSNSVQTAALETQPVAAAGTVLKAAGAVAAAALIYKSDNVVSRQLVNSLDRALDRMQGAEAHCQSNPFTQGPWLPADEHKALPMEVVTGSLPEDLGGAFLRIGTNPGLGRPKSKLYHPFDGDGMLHVVRFKGGRALYSSAMMRTKRYEIEQMRGEEYFTRTLGELRGGVGLLKVLTVLGRKEPQSGISWLDSSTANTNTIFFDGEIFALQESTLPFELRVADDGSISSVGFSTFGGLLDYGVSAHPKLDVKKQQLVFHGYLVAPLPNLPQYKLGIRSKGRCDLDLYTPVSVSRPSFNHDLQITENFVVILDQSIAFDFAKIMEGSLLGFHKKHKLKLGLLPRAAKGDETIWFEADVPIGIVHPFAAYEEDGEVVFWSPACTDFVSGSTFALEDGPFVEPTSFRIMEFRMDPKDPARRIRIHTLEGDYGSVEFSKSHPDLVGYPQRFGYGSWQGFADQTMQKVGGTGFNFRGMLKVDFKTRAIVRTLTFADGCVGGDPSYVPRAGSDVEDDGWLSVVVYDTTRDTTQLHLYNADTFDLDCALAFPVHVPLGFHSNYLSEAQMQEHLQKHAAKM